MKYILLALFIPFTLLINAQNNAASPKSPAAAQKPASTSGTPDASAPNPMEKYPKKKWRKKYRLANQIMKQGSYANAAAYLEDAYKDKPSKLQIPHLLAEVNRYLRDYEAAEKYYKIVEAKDSLAWVNDEFFLGQMQKMNGHYAEAKKSFELYLKFKLDKQDVSYKALAKIEIAGCDSADAILKNPSKVKVEKTVGAVNTPLTDLSPKPLKGDRIMFASQKTDTNVNTTYADANSINYYTSIFTAQKNGKTFSDRKMLPSPPNDPAGNTGNAILSQDEKTIIYTLCKEDTLMIGNVAKCKLYRDTKNGDAWGAPEELTALNNDGGTNTQPAFGVDSAGNPALYFVSDRKGTKGGLDIFYATMKSDGSFSTVVNAGPEINTIGDEMTPFYDAKNKLLYFSSNGHPGIGGLDIFKISGTPGHWGTAVNAGVPINSQADDLYLAVDEKGNGFEVSNRIGTTSSRGSTCCDDIWTVTLKRDVTLKGIYVKRGDATNTPLQGVDASMYKVNGNNFDFVANAKTTGDPFYFPLTRNTSYKINGNKDGYWPGIDNLSVGEDEERDTISQTFYLDPIIKIHIKIPNVYFAFDKSNIISFYKGQIDSVVMLLNQYPSYTLEVQGYTDSKGSDEYNQKLSERRADEVKDFLIKKKHIAANRVVAKWFGKTNPAVPNELPNGEDDPEGRARNRRVEFKVITDKPEDAPEIEHTGEVVKQVKTGPGFTYGKKAKKAPAKTK